MLMRFAKLLVLSALWLIGQGAMAADLIERTAPEEPYFTSYDDVSQIEATAADFVPGNAYVLYNKGSELFYYQGNAWGTQATGSADRAMIVRLVVPEGKTLADKQIYFRNYVPTKTAWMTAFITTGDGNVNGVYGAGTAALFVDNSDGPAALMWIEAAGDKTYRFSISESNSATQPEGKFLGIDPAGPGVGDGAEGTCIMPKSDATTANVDWELRNVPEWTDYFKALDVYNAAEKLRKQIEAAEAAGVDVAAATAVYNNESATIEELNQAVVELKKAQSSGIGSGTAENPSDATAVLSNPNFDDASNEGWSGTKPNMVGAGQHGPANVAEVYNNTFDTYQELEGLPAGVYALRAKTAFRGSIDDMTSGNASAAVLYAKAGDVEASIPFNNIWSSLNSEKMAGPTEFGTTAAENSGSYNGATIYSPNDPSAFRLYEEKGFFSTTLFFEIGEAGAARVGVKNEAKHTDGCDNWSIFDTFSLTYYGNTAESYQKWVELSVPQFSDDITCTKAVKEAYAAKAAELKASNKEEALAAIEQLAAEAAKLQANIALWSQYVALVTEANKKSADPAYAEFMAAGDLQDYIADDYETIMADLELSDEEITAEIEKVQNMMDALDTEAKENIKPGDDVTERYLKNADLEQASVGWEGANSVTAFSDGLVEAYEKNPFDLYQVVKGAKVGVYSISLTGFFRLGPNETAYPAWQDAKANGIELAPVAWVYLNSNKTPLNNVFDIDGDERIMGSKSNPESPAASFYVTDSGVAPWETTDAMGNEITFPNGLGSAHDAFEAGMYKKAAYGLIREGEDLRIGITGKLGGSQWAIWDNFKLVYEGFDATTIKPILEESVAGINDSKPMGKSVFKKVTDVKAAAAKAIENEDGQAMFAALSEIFDLNETIAESVELFQTLAQAREDLLSEMGNLDEATALADEIDKAIANHTIDNEDVATYMNKIAALKTKANLPADFASATDDAPVDVTAVIVNPTYENNDNEGWSGTAAGFDAGYLTTAEIFNTANIDYYQEIIGLPAGTYEVGVQAFYRAGNAADEYLRKDSTEYNKLAFLYGSVIAGNDTTTSAKPLDRLVKCIELDTYEYKNYEVAEQALENYAVVKADTLDKEAPLYSVTYLPNRMATATDMFAYSPDAFQTRVIVKVADGDKLRIGLRKPGTLANDWMFFDEWKLTYFGANSAKEADGDAIANGITEAAAAAGIAKVEFFSLGGAQISKPAKGVTIVKTTMADGTVKVQKIIIK